LHKGWGTRTGEAPHMIEELMETLLQDIRYGLRMLL